MRYKKYLLWGVGIVFSLLLIAYLSMEILLQCSYKNLALGKYTEAAVDSGRAELIAQLLYPVSSEHYQNIFLYDLNVWSKLGTMGMSFGVGPKNLVLTKTIAFIKQNENKLTHEEMAHIRVEAARIANASTHGEGIYSIVGLIDYSHSPVDIWAAYMEEENAYADLTGFLDTRFPKNSDEQKRNELGLELASKHHVVAQEKICQSDTVNCRFNSLRWEIGVCIRQAYAHQSPVCTMETFHDVTKFAGGACKDLTLNQCYLLERNLAPYYHNLLEAQGS